MYRAYDIKLQTSVSAYEAKENADERYRYECLCCGQEVYVAAAYSQSKSAHFRHRKGNNNQRCEKYLGQIGTYSRSVQRKKSCFERAEFVFNIKNKMINLCISFDDDELNRYEQQGAALECRSEDSSDPFLVQKINRLNFAAQKNVLLPIEVFSCRYYLSSTSESIKQPKYLSRNSFQPLFFKATEIDDGAIAKSIHSGLIYTDTAYYVLFHDKLNATKFCNYTCVEPIEAIQYINTAGKAFWLAHFTINEIETSLRSWLWAYGYYLVQSEKLSILWPPAVIKNCSYTVPQGQVYVFSSFQLQAHANVSLPSVCVQSYPGKNIAKIIVNEKAKIYKNGAEMVVNATQLHNAILSKQDIYILQCCKYIIPGDGRFFLSDEVGISELKEGQAIHLTAQSRILHYKNSYLMGYITLLTKDKLTNAELIKDIQQYYRVELEIEERPQNFGIFSDDGQRYIDECIATGRVNPVIKRYIEEGKI